MPGIFDVISILNDTPENPDVEPDLFKDLVNPNRNKNVVKKNDNEPSKAQKAAKVFGSGLMAAGATLGGGNYDPSGIERNRIAEEKNKITAKQGSKAGNLVQVYGTGYGGGQAIPRVVTPNGQRVPAPGSGASSSWDDDPVDASTVPQPAAPPVPQPAPVVPAPALPQVPQMQLQIPQVQPQYQLGQPQIYYSDQNLKTNISNTSKADIRKFMNSISTPKNYDYKNSANGTHTKGGLMAQDLEKSNIGKSAVINTPKGKAVDVGKLTTILASVHSHRINELEKKVEEALNKKFKKGNR